MNTRHMTMNVMPTWSSVLTFAFDTAGLSLSARGEPAVTVMIFARPLMVIEDEDEVNGPTTRWVPCMQCYHQEDMR